MHTRYLTSLVLAVAGGFVVVASQAFATGTTAWLAFAIGIGALILAALPALIGSRQAAALAIDAVGAVLAVWTIVASVVFSGTTVEWLSFAEGVGFVVLAVAGLTLNQVRLAAQVRSHGSIDRPVAADQRSTALAA